MMFADETLRGLAPELSFELDWDDVLRRAGETTASSSRPRVPRRRRRVVLALAVLAAVLVPLAALGSANQWWFLRLGGATPQPTGAAPAVVTQGEWDGHRWQLIAYRSGGNLLCFSVSPEPTTERGDGAALGCAAFVGTSSPDGSSTAMNITYLSGSAPELPAYVAGPVVDSAAEVSVTFVNGDVLRVSTFAAPKSLGGVRFYAAPLPAAARALHAGPAIEKLTGYDHNGNVVACLLPSTAVDGVSPLSDCR
jgi:hypothetical protein